MAESMKEALIREYISKIDFKSENWKISDMKKEMKTFLGEEPGVDIGYTKDVLINEGSEEAKEILKTEKITIVFTDLDLKYKKLEFKL